MKIICTNYLDALNAYKHGIEGIELCNDADMTPSFGTVKLIMKNTDLEIFVKVQSKENDHIYNYEHFEQMKLDTLLFMKEGVKGICFSCFDKFNDVAIEQVIILNNIIKKYDGKSVFCYKCNKNEHLEKVIKKLIFAKIDFIEIKFPKEIDEINIKQIEDLYYKYKKNIGFIIKVTKQNLDIIYSLNLLTEIKNFSIIDEKYIK